MAEEKDNEHKEENLKSAGQDKGRHNYDDPSGTDPERYERSDSDREDDSSEKKPKNHTTTSERMINPDRGE